MISLVALCLVSVSTTLGGKAQSGAGRSVVVESLFDNDLPEQFDARTEWPACSALIGTVPDEGNCRASWAVQAAAVMSDRTCIGSPSGTKKVFSVWDILGCCQFCQRDCAEEGDPRDAFYYWSMYGVVSGAGFGETTGCRPYALPPCHVDQSCTGHAHLACRMNCSNGLDYTHDKTKGGLIVEIHQAEHSIKAEIKRFGPVVATVDVYDDFVDYKGGVYKPPEGAVVTGRRSLRLIGWGSAQDGPFWLAVNSWGPGWGEQGRVRIQRGTARIEQHVVTARLPT